MSEATARVGDLKAAVQAAKDRVAEFDAARKEGARRVERARAELMDFYRRQGRGDEPDSDLPMGSELPLETAMAMGQVVGQVVHSDDSGVRIEGDRESDLVNALREAEHGLSAHVEHYPQEGDLLDVRLDAVDEAAEARYQGSVERLEAREAELREFVTANHGGIEVERAPQAASIRNRCEAVRGEGQALGAEWERFRTGTVELAQLGGRPELIDEIPDNPMRWVQEMGEPGLPMPESFTG